MFPSDSLPCSQMDIWAINRTDQNEYDIDFIEERILALKKMHSISSLRFYLGSYLDLRIIPDFLWRTGRRLRVDVLRPLLQSEASIESLMKPLLVLAVIHPSTFATEISMDPSVQNAKGALVEVDNALILQLLAGDERSPLYWIKRAIEVVNIAYPDPSHSEQVEYRVLNFDADDIDSDRSKQDSTLERSHHECHEKTMLVDHLKLVLQTVVHDLANFESMYNLPRIDCAKGRYPDVNGQVTRNIQKRYLNAQSPIQFGTYGSLGEAFIVTGHFNLLIHCCLRAFSIEEICARETWATIMQTVENMAQSYAESGKAWHAFELYLSVLELKRTLFGIDHINTADTLNNMGISLQRMRKYDEAVNYLNQALHIYESKRPHEMDQTKLANTLQNLGIVYSEQGHQALAITYFRRAIRFANCDLVLKGIINNLGVAFARKGSLAEAIAFYSSALKVTSTNHGRHDLDAADILYNIGVTEVNIGRMDSGKKHLRKSNRIFNDILGQRHFKSMRTQGLLKMLQRRERLRKSGKSRN